MRFSLDYLFSQAVSSGDLFSWCQKYVMLKRLLVPVCGSEIFYAYIVLSQLFFLVLDTPCHVRHGGENVSHGVIMTNPPTHTQLTSSSISFPHSVVILPCFSCVHPQSESRISCFLPPHCWFMTIQKTFRHIWLGRVFDGIVWFCQVTAVFTSAISLFQLQL